MSKKLIELIEESINTEKARYCKELIDLCKNNFEYIEILNIIIQFYYNEVNHANEKVAQGTSNFNGNKCANEIQKLYGDTGKELYMCIYKNLINGLYRGSEKDNFENRVIRLYRNKENIVDFIIDHI